MKSVPFYAAGSGTPTRIFDVRGRRIILDYDLAMLYGVPTKRLNEQVRRNPERFPDDFAFFLSATEWRALKAQSGSSTAHGGRRAPPRAFTEHGALMAAGVLNSSRAIEVSIYVVRAFIAMREATLNTKELGKRLDDLERSAEGRFSQHDKAISEIFAAIRALMNPPSAKRKPIGFVRSDDPEKET